MKRILFLIICFSGWGSIQAQNPQISGDLMLCPWTSGTVTVANPTFDTYQWYSKFWFTNDAYVAIPGATQASFTYDWYTYDQSLFKVVATLNGTSYESNVIQIDSYAWVGFTVGTEQNDYVTIDWNTGNHLLCTGGSFTASIFMPYNAGIQWFNNGIAIPGANQMTYLITGPGVYHVVAAPDFCPNSTSNNESLPIVVEENTNCNLDTNNPISMDNSVSLYPNPVNDVLSLSITNDILITGYSIIDVNGKELFKNELETVQNTAQINVSNLSGGFYMLKLTGENQSTVKKFIKK